MTTKTEVKTEDKIKSGYKVKHVACGYCYRGACGGSLGKITGRINMTNAETVDCVVCHDIVVTNADCANGCFKANGLR